MLDVVWIASILWVQTAQEVTFVDVKILKGSIANCLLRSEKCWYELEIAAEWHDKPFVLPINFNRA